MPETAEASKPGPGPKVVTPPARKPPPRVRSRLDVATVAGIAVALGGILGGLILEKGSIQDVAQTTAAMIVLGGTVGAVLVPATGNPGTPRSFTGRDQLTALFAESGGIETPAGSASIRTVGRAPLVARADHPQVRVFNGTNHRPSLDCPLTGALRPGPAAGTASRAAPQWRSP